MNIYLLPNPAQIPIWEWKREPTSSLYPLPSRHSQYWWPVSNSQGLSTATPNLWGDLLDLWGTPWLLSCSCPWGSGFSPLEVTVGKGYCTPRSRPSRESSYIQGGHLNSSLYLSDAVSKWGTVTSTRSMTFPGSESYSDGEHKQCFHLCWSGRRKVYVQLNPKITLLLFEFSYSEWSTHHDFTSSGKGT